jgi:hypothetical protein
MRDHNWIPGAERMTCSTWNLAGAPFVRGQMFHVKQGVRVTHDNGPTVSRGTADFEITSAKGTGPLHSLSLVIHRLSLPPRTSMFHVEPKQVAGDK